MFNRKKLQAQMVLKGFNAEKLSSILGINTSTFYRKLGNDGDFSRKEIHIIIKTLEIENPMDIFFAEEVA